jgi:hypothetical protein
MDFAARLFFIHQRWFMFSPAIELSGFYNSRWQRSGVIDLLERPRNEMEDEPSRALDNIIGLGILLSVERHLFTAQEFFNPPARN